MNFLAFPYPIPLKNVIETPNEKVSSPYLNWFWNYPKKVNLRATLTDPHGVGHYPTDPHGEC